MNEAAQDREVSSLQWNALNPEPHQPLRVLLVDDNAINRQALKGMLQAEGIQALEAADGLQALRLLEREDADAVISDLLMPNVTGYQLCCEIRRDRRHSAIPFILYTASHIELKDRRLALELGVDRFIRRPVPPLDLLTALAELTAKRRNSPARTELPGELSQSRTYNESLVRRLQDSEARFRGIFENIHDVYFATDTRYALQLVSPSVSRYGYQPDDLIGCDIEKLLFRTPAERDRFKHALRTDTSLEDFEVELKAKNGGLVVMSLNARLIIGENRHAEGVEGLLRDVTERSRAAKMLRRNEERFRALLENCQAAIALISRSGTVQYVSRSLLGFKVEELTGKECFAFVHEEDVERTRMVFQECVLAPGVPVTTEYRSRHKDGSWRHIEAVAVNRLDDPSVGAVIVNYDDVSQQKAAECERERLIVKLRETLAQVKTLEGILSICASCKKIRDDAAGEWSELEWFISSHSLAEFSHDLCPDCAKSYYA